MSDTRRVWCASGAHRAPAEGAEVVKASTPSGRAWRCATCGEQERARIRAVNREIAGGARR